MFSYTYTNSGFDMDIIKVQQILNSPNVSDPDACFMIQKYILERKGKRIEIDLKWAGFNISFRDEEEEHKFLRALNSAIIWFDEKFN